MCVCVCVCVFVCVCACVCVRVYAPLCVSMCMFLSRISLMWLFRMFIINAIFVYLCILSCI